MSTTREDINLLLCRELRVALDRNPGLNVQEVLDLAVTSIHMNASCHNKGNTEMLVFLKKYNQLRDHDASRYHVQETLKA